MEYETSPIVLKHHHVSSLIFEILELIKFIRKFDGLNLITLLSEIITSSFVLGFLPILAFYS